MIAHQTIHVKKQKKKGFLLCPLEYQNDATIF